MKAFKAGWAYGETARGLRRLVRGRARADGARHLPEHHRQPGARARPGRRERAERAAALPRRLPDHARLRDPRGPLAAQALRRAHVPGRGRDRRRRAPRWARASAARSASARRAARASCSRPRRSGSRSTLELPLLILDIQRAGPVDRDADEARAGRPADGACFGRNAESPVPVVAAVDAGRLLRRRDRGGADRAQVPDAGLPALRRVPGERLRAVAAARRRRRCRTSRSSSRPSRTATASSCRTCATPRRSRARGRSRGRRASSTGSAASRSRTRPATSPTTPTTTTAWCGCAPQKVAGIAADIPELEVDDPERRVAARARLGRHVRPDHAPPSGGCARAAARSRRRT